MIFNLVQNDRNFGIGLKMASEENDLFDVEAQQLPLLPTHEPESTSRRTWRMAILFIRSANLFKSLGENYSTDGSSSDSSVSISLPAYTSVGTPDGEDNAVRSINLYNLFSNLILEFSKSYMYNQDCNN